MARRPRAVADVGPRRVGARILVAVGVGATLATWLAPWWWPGELLASFRPHLAIWCLALAITCVVLRRPLPGLALVAVALLGAGQVGVVTSEPRPAQQEPGAPTLALAQQNAQGGAGTAASVLRHLGRHPVDVLVVLEPAPDWGVFLREPARAMGYEVVVPEDGLADEQVLLLARVPVRDVVLPDGGLPPAAVSFSVPLGDETVHALAVHLRNPLTPARWRARNAQLEAIAAWARDQHGSAVVLGDLNLAPWSPRFADLERESGLAPSTEGRPTQASWPWWPGWLRRLGIPIDHLLHTPDLVVVDHEVQPSIGSQHGVLAVTLAPTT